MNNTNYTFTAQDWAEHERFVEMFHAAKIRKRERLARLERELEAEEEYARKRRAEVDALFND